MNARRLTVAVVFGALFGMAAPPDREFRDSERRYWAFQKVVKPPVPAVQNRSWVRTPVDAFILAKLEEKKLPPNAPADKITLLRRLALDLTGLPPSPEEVQAFLNDTSAQAYENLVDRLLASPHYGERWARHWLDLARYADTEGFKGDETRPYIWRYRDYVIESLNQDKPYDRFIKEQIAGDELFPEDASAKVATGFNRHWPDESNMNNPIQRRQEILNDITDTVGSVFLGLTVGCARCHDHKFDPILHKDYYRLQAFFANTRNEDRLSLVVGESARQYRDQRALWEAATTEIRASIEELFAKARAKKSADVMLVFPPEVREAFETPVEKRTPWQQQMFMRGRDFAYGRDEDLPKTLRGDDKKRYDELAIELAKFDHLKPAEPAIAQGMIDEGRTAPATHILTRGSWENPEPDEIAPGFLSILDPAPARIAPPEGMNSSGRRAALANWIADPRNPLTARVMVNRIWSYHFGQGIVGTPSDFGVMGDRPTHKELLDYLAAEFVENGWSIKKLHRMILLSNTYRESSNWSEKSAGLDPSNKLRWHFERRRLDGEVIRDAMLSVSQQLNPKMGGPGVFPPLPPGTIAANSRYSDWKVEKEVAEANRRSVYIFVKRNLRYPMFEAFDFPDTHESCARRYATVTATQSLELINSDLVLEWARLLASRVLNDSGLSSETEIDRLYNIVYSRKPKPGEREAIASFLKTQASILSTRLASPDDKLPMPAPLLPGVDPSHAAAFVELCHALLNSNEFLYMN